MFICDLFPASVDVAVVVSALNLVALSQAAVTIRGSWTTSLPDSFTFVSDTRIPRITLTMQFPKDEQWAGC